MNATYLPLIRVVHEQIFDKKHTFDFSNHSQIPYFIIENIFITHLNDVLVREWLMRLIVLCVLEEDLVHVGGGILVQLVAGAEDDQRDLTVAQHGQLVRFLHNTKLSFVKRHLNCFELNWIVGKVRWKYWIELLLFVNMSEAILVSQASITKFKCVANEAKNIKNTCLFLSSVIRDICIFFLPMMIQFYFATLSFYASETSKIRLIYYWLINLVYP